MNTGHKIVLPILIIIFFVGILFSQENEQVTNLNTLIEEGLNNNPQLKAFYSKVKADSAMILPSGSLPDPTLSLNLLNLPVDNFVFDQEPMTGKQIGIMQKFPFPGKLGLKEKIAEKGAMVSDENYNELRLQLIKNIKTAYYDLYYIDEAITTTEKNRELLSEFVNIAEKKYSVGKGLQQDVLKAQVELSRLLDRLLNQKQMREKIESNLNALLNRKTDQSYVKTKEVTYRKVDLTYNDVEKLAVKRRPLFKAWQLRIDQNGDKVNLAEKEYWPDFSIFAAYTQRDVLQSGMSGVDFLSGGITLQLPLYFWRKQGKQVEENQLLKLNSEQQFSNVKNQNLAALNNAFTDLIKNEERLDLYNTGIIPQASQALQSAMIGYQTDKVDFLTLVNNQMTLFNLQLEYAQILSDYNKNIAELEYLSGGELPESNN